MTELCITVGFCPFYPGISKKIKHIQGHAMAEGKVQSHNTSTGGKEAWGAKKMEPRSFQCTQGQDKR